MEFMTNLDGTKGLVELWLKRKPVSGLQVPNLDERVVVARVFDG